MKIKYINNTFNCDKPNINKMQLSLLEKNIKTTNKEIYGIDDDQQIEIKFSSVDVTYSTKTKSEFLRFNRKVKGGQVYYKGSCNNIDHQKWIDLIIKHKLYGYVTQKGKYNTVHIRFNVFNDEVINIIKKEFDATVVFNYNCMSESTTNILECYYSFNPHERQISINDISYTCFNGFEIEFMNSNNDEQILFVSCESQSIIISGNKISGEFREWIKQFIADVPNIYDKSSVLQDIDKNNNIYCSSNIDNETDYDYKILIDAIKKIEHVFDNKKFMICAHLSYMY